MKDVKIEKATFGAGCFWGVEEEFRKLKGVISTRVGYIGGNSENPTYEEVSSDATGHAEAVEITFNSEIVSYKDILNLFWQMHDPTQRNRQGVDVGSQYRSVIFYHSNEQLIEATNSKNNLEQSKKFLKTIVTEILPTKTFWEAEEYHQQYLEKRGLKTCHL